MLNSVHSVKKTMPLETREGYVKLNEHLWEIDPIARSFAAEMGYEYGPPMSNGLYPKLRMWRTKNGVSQNINFDMEGDDRDERFDHFFPEIPYSAFAGSWIDDHEKKIRHHGPHLGIRRTPFTALRTSITEFLRYFHAHNESVTPELVYACGFTTRLG
jgi:hypothetical protein